MAQIMYAAESPEKCLVMTLITSPHDPTHSITCEALSKAIDRASDTMLTAATVLVAPVLDSTALSILQSILADKEPRVTTGTAARKGKTPKPTSVTRGAVSFSSLDNEDDIDDNIGEAMANMVLVDEWEASSERQPTHRMYPTPSTHDIAESVEGGM